MTLTHSIALNQERSEQLADEVSLFLAQGGQITHVQSEVLTPDQQNILSRMPIRRTLDFSDIQKSTGIMDQPRLMAAISDLITMGHIKIVGPRKYKRLERGIRGE